MEKNIACLEHLQDRAQSRPPARLRRSPASGPSAHIEGQVYDPDEDFPLENGFVFSKAEILAAIHRADRKAAADYYEKRGWNADRKYESHRKEVLAFPKAA